MPTTLKLSCSGCFVEAEGTKPLSRKFRSFSGNDYGFGTYVVEPIDDSVPEGWVMFDPHTGCTYCPKCWADIETEETP